MKRLSHTRIISLDQYCPKMRRPLDVRELIIKEVNIVDAINYKYERPQIPKNLECQKLKKSVGLWNFLKTEVLKSLP